jgi:hypothetical protein
MENRTGKQNNAMHLFFENASTSLNEAGMEMRGFLKEGIDIWWTPHSFKEYVWKPIQIAMTGKESTKDLTTKEVTQIYEVLSRHLGEVKKIYIPFPSNEELL